MSTKGTTGQGRNAFWILDFVPPLAGSHQALWRSFGINACLLSPVSCPKRWYNLRTMHIGLTYDLQSDPSDERQAEFDSPATISALRSALETLGHSVALIGGAKELLRIGPRGCCDFDIVFNIAEGTQGRCREAWVPMLLEQWGLPFVGSGSAAQALALDKIMSKRIARASNVTTPNWRVVESMDAFDRIEAVEFPLIVKPRYEGSGIGIDSDSIVHEPRALRERVEWVISRYSQPCLIENFITFGELTVFLIGNHPPHTLPAVQRPIDESSRLSCHVAKRSKQEAWLSPVDLTPELDSQAQRIAVTMFESLGCRDMARVDLRVDEKGMLYFLEINPLPSFDPEGSLGLLAEYLGTTYTDLIGRILDAAMRRMWNSECGMRSEEFKVCKTDSGFRTMSYE